MNVDCFKNPSLPRPDTLTLAKVPTVEHNQLVAALLGPSFAGEFPWIGVYNWALFDYYFSQIDQKPLLFSNWETGLPNHLSGNTQRCVQMNWRSKQTYQHIVTLGKFNLISENIISEV